MSDREDILSEVITVDDATRCMRSRTDANG